MSNEYKTKNEMCVPYIVYESSLAREERHSKRLIIVVITLICCWLITIGVFMWYISLPVEESYTTQNVEDIDSSNVKQIGGNDYGKSDADHN